MKRETRSTEIYRSDLIRGKLAELDMDIETAAARSNLNKNTVSKIRNGKDVRVSSLTQLAMAVNLPLAQVFAPREPETALAE